jgi:hypothetical protein
MGAMKRKQKPSAAESLNTAYRNEQQVAQGVNPFRAGEEISAERQQQAQQFCERYGPSIEQALDKVSALSEVRGEIGTIRDDAKEALPTDAEAAMMIFGGSTMGVLAALPAGFNDLVEYGHGVKLSDNLATFNESIQTIKDAQSAPTELLNTYEAFEGSMIKLEGSLKRFENSVVSAARAIESGNQEKINAAMAKMEKRAKAVSRAGESAQTRLEQFSNHAANFHLATGVVGEFKENAQSAIVSTVAISVGIGALGLAARGGVSLARASSYGRTQVALAESGAFLQTVRFTGQASNLTAKGGKALNLLKRGTQLTTQNAPALRRVGTEVAKQTGKRGMDIYGAEQTISEAVNDVEEYVHELEPQSRPKPPEAKKEEPKAEQKPTIGTKEPEVWEQYDYSKGQSRME